MLTEDRDDFSVSNEHVISNRPKRNLNTRRAIKETRTSEKALRGNSGHLETNFIGCNNENVAPYDKQQSERSQTKKQIELGDYILPPDKKEETLGGIKSCKTTEYADPYETQQIMEALRAKGRIRYSALPESSGPRFSSVPHNTARSFSVPVDDSHDLIYEKAKPLDDEDISSKSNIEGFRHTYCEGNTPVSGGTSVDSGVEDPDEYDHTVTWMINGKNKMAQVIPNTSENHIVPDQKEKQLCGQSPIPPCQDQLYAGSYEDPWDSTGSKQKFDNIITKAKMEYRKTSQSDDYEEPVVSPSTYEEAWDLKSKEKDLENQVQEAHRRMSEGQQNSRRPRKNYDYFEPWNTPKGHEQNVENFSPTKIKNGKPADLVYSDAYEDPWDIKQREREQALEKQFSNIHSPKSPKDEVPNFPAPPPPKLQTQTYEEAWERSQSSQFPSRSPHNSGHSPNQRRYTEGQRPARSDFAERIDPNLPLDIQSFYHGKIARKDAEDLLRIHKEGSYLVRRSETQANVFSLSLKGIGGMPMHLRISLEGGMYILGENSKPFPTVPEMIDFYTRSELPVLKADRIKLLHPIPRPKTHY